MFVLCELFCAFSGECTISLYFLKFILCFLEKKIYTLYMKNVQSVL